MKGAVLSLSCSSYENYQDLPFAENDARTLLESLKRSDSIYTERLCLNRDSLSSREFMSFLASLSIDLRGLDLVTFYFSGHGFVENKNFYLCFRDFDAKLPSLTGISLSQIIRIFNDLGVRSVNLIVDACFSGQSIRDLREIVEGKVNEDDRNISVSVLAAALSNQVAWGAEPLSDFTGLLIDYVEGGRDSHSRKANLSLADLVEAISGDQKNGGHQQNVVFSALNLLGDIPFCENRLGAPGERIPHNQIMSPSSSMGKAISIAKGDLARIYQDMDCRFDDVGLRAAFLVIVQAGVGQEVALLELLTHYYNWLGSRADQSNDWSIRGRIAGAIVASSIPICIENARFRFGILEIVKDSLTRDAKIIASVRSDYILEDLGLDCTPSVDDFHFLPLRLCAIYARVGLIMMIEKMDGVILIENREDIFRLLVDLLVGSHVINIENQSVQFYIFCLSCYYNSKSELAEIPWGLFFNDLVSHSGLVLRDDVTGDQVFEYLRLKVSKSITIDCSGIAIPNTVLPMMILAADALRLNDVLDGSLVMWDGITTNIFLPKDLNEFGLPAMQSGRNVTLTVGRDFYNCEEYIDLLRSELGCELADPAVGLDLQLLLMLIAHVMPDRVPLPDFVMPS